MMIATADGGFLWRFGVRIRNKLVHEGRFLSRNKNDWHGEYAFMIWSVWLCADFLDTMES